MSKNCYCQSGKPFKECCEPYIKGLNKPADPEILMRSRFSAFCTQSIDYLLATHHPTRHSTNERAELEKACASTQWTTLKVIESYHAGNKGTVEFVAFFDQGTNEPGQLHERSNFVLENDQWFYVDGEFLPDIKLGRNDVCWCGSGRKLKKCHPS